MTSNPADSGRPRESYPLVLAGFGVAIVAVVAYALTTLSPASATNVVSAVGHFVGAAAGGVCLGGLVLILITARPGDRGVLDPPAFRAHLVVERAAPIWLLTALVMVVVRAAVDAGGSAVRLLSSGKLSAAVGASEAARSWVAVATLAAVLTVVLRLSLRWEWHVPMVIPALVGVVAVPVTGNAGQGPDHDYATSSVIVFAAATSIWAGVKIVSVVAPCDRSVQRRADIAAIVSAAMALAYGSLLLALRAGATGLTSGYGLLGLLAGSVLSATLIADTVALRRRSTAVPLAAAAGAIGVLAALSLMAIQVAPRLLATRPTIWDILLGYELPGPPTPARLLWFWRFDTFLGITAVVLGGAYIWGVIKLRRRGDEWPAGRSVAWLAGCGALAIATGSGVRSYGSAMFSVHMAEHMMLNMFVPVLLVLGAPVTLALRALPGAAPGAAPGPREWIVRAVHSPFTEFLSNPITAFVLFVGSLYAVYFTPLFDTFVRYHWGHELMSVHFLITGYLFYWGIIGIDPGPRRLPFIGRLALLFAVMPFHAFFGVAMMTMTSVTGGHFYRSLGLPWMHNLNDDQHLGGAIAWGASEVPLVVVVIALVTQWARQDRRTSIRSDRHADAGYDDDMAAYNNMLRELARQRTTK